MTVPQVGAARVHEYLALSDRLDLTPARVVEDCLSALLVGRGTDDDHIRVPGRDLLHGNGPSESLDLGCIDRAGNINPVVDHRLPAVDGQYSAGSRMQHFGPGAVRQLAGHARDLANVVVEVANVFLRHPRFSHAQDLAGEAHGLLETL